LSKGTKGESKDPENSSHKNAGSGSSNRQSPLLYHLHVLESIDNVDWSKISHAYGPATDVPAQLRALAFGDEQERQRALHALHGNIWHQHTIYEATAVAVPFLVELVQNQVPAQEEVLSLIALIATGSSYMKVHKSLLGKWTAEDEEQLQREQQWVKAAKSAVTAHSGFFFELMKTSNRRIRELCILILGAVESESEVEVLDVIERIFGID
jgi:hypothetical protein